MQQVLTKYKIYSVLRRAGVRRSQPAKGRRPRGTIKGWSQGYRLMITDDPVTQQPIYHLLYVEAFPVRTTNRIEYDRTACVGCMQQALDQAGLYVTRSGEELLVSGYKAI